MPGARGSAPGASRPARGIYARRCSRRRAGAARRGRRRSAPARACVAGRPGPHYRGRDKRGRSPPGPTRNLRPAIPTQFPSCRDSESPGASITLAARPGPPGRQADSERGIRVRLGRADSINSGSSYSTRRFRVAGLGRGIRVRLGLAELARAAAGTAAGTEQMEMTSPRAGRLGPRRRGHIPPAKSRGAVFDGTPELLRQESWTG
jgi:hypothetical protein